MSCTRVARRVARSSMKNLAQSRRRAADEPLQRQFAVGVDGGPSPSVASTVRRRFRGLHVFLLRIGEGPDFIDLHALATSRCARVSSWNVMQTCPASASSLATVFLLTPVMRVMARMLMPSANMWRTWVRFSGVSLFILTICMTDQEMQAQTSSVLAFWQFDVIMHANRLESLHDRR